MFDLIVVAVDGSEHSLKALNYACELAEKHGSKMILMHVYRSTSDLRGTGSFDHYVAKRKQLGEEIIKDARGHMKKTPFEVEENLLEGPAADAIISVVRARKADLVVMGTRGTGTLKGLLVGNVSTKVTHHAPCPVLVVR